MREYSPAELTYLQSRSGIVAHFLVWISARHRTMGITLSVGLWSGADHQSITINGVPRLYYGAGDLIDMDPIDMQPGLVVKLQRLQLAATSPEVVALIQDYDLAFAPIEIRRALFDPITGALVAEPRVIGEGRIEEAPLPTPEKGGSAPMEVVWAGIARALTKALTITKSDAVQQLRGGDRFNRYRESTGKVTISWGEVRK